MSNVQNFKGDNLELKFQSVGNPIFDLADSSLDDFYSEGFESTPFLLMLYDEGRMPFSNRIPREAFVDFIKQALKRFPVTGIFETYLFVLRSLFGEMSEINFEIPSPGKLEIDINAIASTTFDFIGREFIDGSYTFFNIVDEDGNILQFRGIPGLSTEYELYLLFSEIMPAGIVPVIALTFYSFFDFIAWDDFGNYEMIDNLGNNIILREIGG